VCAVSAAGRVFLAVVKLEFIVGFSGLPAGNLLRLCFSLSEDCGLTHCSSI